MRGNGVNLVIINIDIYINIYVMNVVVYIRTKMIQTKPYTICSSHQLGLEVERPEWRTSFFF